MQLGKRRTSRSSDPKKELHITASNTSNGSPPKVSIGYIAPVVNDDYIEPNNIASFNISSSRHRGYIKTEHCLDVAYRYLTEKDVKTYISTVITDVQEIICSQSPYYIPNCKFIVNVPVQRDTGDYRCYLWVTSVEVFRMLIGKTYDGAEIIENQPALSAKEQLFTIDWSEPIPVVCERYNVPTYKYKDELGIYQETSAKFSETRVSRVSKEYVEGTLFCKNQLPPTISADDLVSLFIPFALSGRVVAKKTAKGNAYITFDDKDSTYFALVMMMKHTYRDRTGKETYLSFGHSKFSSER